MTDSPAIDWTILKAWPRIERKGSIFAGLCTRVRKITLYPHRQTWTKYMQACPHGHTHARQTYSPAKESPQRGAVHTVFTALLNYWLVVFLLLWEATPYEQGERLAHKNCSRTLSLKPDRALLTSASLLNRTLAFLGTVWLARLLILSIFHHCCLFVSFILIFSPAFFPPLSPSLTESNLPGPRRLHNKLDCRLCSAKTHVSHRLTLNY